MWRISSNFRSFFSLKDIDEDGKMEEFTKDEA
jgi:hypothetical protein